MKSEQNSNSEKSAFPVADTIANGERYEPLTLGLTKRELLASNYAGISDKFFDDVSTDFIKKFLGLDENVDYDCFLHYPKVVVKLQLMFADELLKQLS